MECPRCGAPQPPWPQVCEACGHVLFTPPALEPPPDLGPAAPGAAAPAEPAAQSLPPPPAPEPARDVRTHIVVGALLAFVSTLVLPIFLGPVAMALGWFAYAKGQGKQRTQGLLVIAFAAAATVLGTWLGLWAMENLLTPPAPAPTAP